MVHIISVSDKLLTGKQINTISAYFAEMLFKYNFKIANQIIVPSVYEFSSLLKQKKTGDIFIFLSEKGNLGLNQALANITDCDVVENENVKDSIYEYYRKRNCPLERDAENEWKLPSKARAIINPNNTTQGYIINNQDTIYCVLPTNYSDAVQMFNDVVLDYLIASQKKKYKNYTFKTFGLTVSNLNSILADLIKNKDKVSVNLFEKDCSVDIVVKAQDDNDKLDEISKKIFLKLDKYIYSVGDVPISKVAYDLIKLNDLKISFAETITGGKIASNFITQGQDANSFVIESVVVNSNTSKKKLLKIDDTQNFDGKVSVELAHQIALNLLEGTDTDIVVSSVATPVDNQNPTCLCYIAVGDRREIHIFKNMFAGAYSDIIENIVTASYFYLIKKLKKNDFHFEKSTV